MAGFGDDSFGAFRCSLKFISQKGQVVILVADEIVEPLYMRCLEV